MVVFWIILFIASLYGVYSGVFGVLLDGFTIWTLLPILALALLICSVIGINKSAQARVSVKGIRDKKTVKIWKIIFWASSIGFPVSIIFLFFSHIFHIPTFPGEFLIFSFMGLLLYGSFVITSGKDKSATPKIIPKLKIVPEE